MTNHALAPTPVVDAASAARAFRVIPFRADSSRLIPSRIHGIARVR